MMNLAWIILAGGCILLPFLLFYGFKLQGKKFRTVLGINIFSFFAIISIMIISMWSGNIYAANEAGAAASSASGMGFLAAALSTGLACVGAGIAVAAASSSALGAISEDPGMMGRTLIFVALAEGIALYGLVISIMILGRLG